MAPDAEREGDHDNLWRALTRILGQMMMCSHADNMDCEVDGVEEAARQKSLLVPARGRWNTHGETLGSVASTSENKYFPSIP